MSEYSIDLKKGAEEDPAERTYWYWRDDRYDRVGDGKYQDSSGKEFNEGDLREQYEAQRDYGRSR